MKKKITWTDALRVLLTVAAIVGALWLFGSCVDGVKEKNDAARSEAYSEAYQEGYNAGRWDSYKRMKEISETEGYNPEDLARLHRLGDLTDEELAGKLREILDLYKYLEP